MPDGPEFHEFAQLAERGDATGQRYLEFLRGPTMSVGLYTLAAGGQDPQQPHAEDELYIVLAGRAVVHAGGASRPVGPGSLVYVPAEVPHRFTDITEDLRVAVVFAPPESRPTGAAE
ncbi:cupin domain-containing protein [Streptomyces sp. NPDC050161]|uniref:cupin domain-containing protein n=1 Tax=Streptomyces sp. NPDC050161 TaxID=3365604 RepID=UPI00378E8914